MIPSRIPLVFLLLLCLILVPATASLTKVANDAPIFIGERNLDLTACLNATHGDRMVARGFGPERRTVKDFDDFRGCNVVLC